MKIRNIIHGMDTVMSHITHLYHLSAPDFINFAGSPGSLVNMSPWTPSYKSATDAFLIDGSSPDSSLRQNLILHYVDALRVRRLVHTAGALFSGRQPIQNAIVPGGVTTLWDGTYPLTAATSDYDQFGPYNAGETKTRFGDLITTIRTFIDTSYIPDVLAVASYFPSYFTQGVGCANLLSYGEYPDNNGVLLIKRGMVLGGAVGTLTDFDQANIVEQINSSWYDYPATDALLQTNGRHPFDGVTVPNVKGGGTYSWLKSPRYGPAATVLEVGPLARMAVTYSSSNQLVASSLNAVGTLLSAGATYNVKTLVDATLDAVGSAGNALPLVSALGRHAARALESKLIADASDAWVKALPIGNSNCYTYTKIPKQISTGYGLAEAPRGALGHWIKIEGRKVAKYQCVVPSTWNFSPKDANGTPGPVEQSLIGSFIGTDDESRIVNILRIVHPFDCCIACAVHVVGPDGKEKLRFAIDPDGRPSKIVKSE